MPIRRRTALLAVPAAALALTLGACGNAGQFNLHAADESQYIDVGPLQYQVQISRELNPADVEDRAYFQGLSPAERRLPRDEVWFGVFLRVTNPSKQIAPTAEKITMVDTQGHEYTPLAYAQPNAMAYVPTRVGPGGSDPRPGSIAAEGPTNGGVLIFKVTLESLEDRPLTLRVQNPADSGQVGTVSLDV